jgi:flagellar biosynthesis/type III secretory pathway chaperone
MEEERFLELIDLYIKGYEALIELSQKVSLALVNRDVKSLTDLTNTESVILGELFRIKDEAQLENFSEMLDSLSKESEDKIKNKLVYLGELIVKLNDMSKANSRLLEENLGLINKYIDIIKKDSSSNNLIVEEMG